MKKILSILIVAILAFGMMFTFTGCDQTSNNNSETGVICSKVDGKYVLDSYVDEGEGYTELDIEGAVKEKYGSDAVVYRIKTGAFDGNDNLKAILVPKTVTRIDAGAFKNMTALEELILPFVGSNINADAFVGQTDSGEDKAVNEERLFGYIFGTTEYEGGSKITQYFDGTTAKSYYIPFTLRKVQIDSAKEYEVPMYAFSGLTFVSEITFGDKVVGIGEGAFYNAQCLKSLALSKSIVNIYKNAFNGFSTLETIEYAGTSNEWSKVNKGVDWKKGVAENFTITIK